jgi:hypothetical protein
MGKYTRTVNIWNLNPEGRRKLQIGQWVRAGYDGPIGRFYGEGATTVVAWLDNARGHSKAKGGTGYGAYMAALRDYGRASMKRCDKLSHGHNF